MNEGQRSPLYSIFERDSRPYGKSWEEWAAFWCQWLLSIPRNENPSLDKRGENCAQNQSDPNVWFLGGTFGNIEPIVKKCIIPIGRAVLLSPIEKEDSFAEDIDLQTEAQLLNRAKQFIDRVVHLYVSVNGSPIRDLYRFRVSSVFFNLTFPEEGVYDVKPGPTRAVCAGYWIFLKPTSKGRYTIRSEAEVLMPPKEVVTDQFLNDPLYSHIKEDIIKNCKFRLYVTHEIQIT